MNFLNISLFYLLLVTHLIFANEDGGVVSEEVEPDSSPVQEVPEEEIPYLTPRPLGNYYIAEHFDDREDFNKHWVRSEAKKDEADATISKYNGIWEIEPAEKNRLVGDLGLALKSKARHHAISAPLDKPFVFDNKPFILQYEVKFQNGQDCGGAYIKLFSSQSDLELKTVTDKTPYTIMFGPDKCGTDSKLHFIFRHANPKTKVAEEKHWKKAANVPKLDDVFKDKKPHLFTLIVSPDNTFEVMVDRKSVQKGSLFEEFSPSVNPPSEIDDPTDLKPDNWDDREKIADPTSTKPADWDEEAPRQIVDPASVKPADWLDDEPELIPDPNAQKPKDWDDEMDGEWEAPLISNPNCENVGCGEWKAPMMDNPSYKGKWKATLIDNPNYRGKWKPKKVPNPDFHEDKHPYRLTTIAAVGFELWSMSDNLLFDNLIITDDGYVAEQWAADTWALKKELADRETDNIFVRLIKYTNKQPWLWAVYLVAVALPVVLFISFCCTTKKEEDQTYKHKKTDEPLPNATPPSTSSSEAPPVLESTSTIKPPEETIEEELTDSEEQDQEESQEDDEAKDESKSEEEDQISETKEDKQTDEGAAGDGHTRSSPRKRNRPRKD